MAIAAAAGFVVLRQIEENRWELLGEFERKPGMTARTARSEAIHDATQGRAQAGEVYAAVLRSEWRVAKDWLPPNELTGAEQATDATKLTAN